MVNTDGYNLLSFHIDVMILYLINYFSHNICLKHFHKVVNRIFADMFIFHPLSNKLKSAQ